MDVLANPEYSGSRTIRVKIVSICTGCSQKLICLSSANSFLKKETENEDNGDQLFPCTLNHGGSRDLSSRSVSI